MGLETLAAISIGSAVVGGGINMMGARSSADAQESMYNYRAQVAANNEIIAQRNAAAAVERGGIEATNQSLKSAQVLGRQKVAQAGSGLDVNSGSNLAVRQSTSDLAHLDMLTILDNARRTASGYQVQAMNFASEGTLNRAAAQNADIAGNYAVASSLMSTADTVSNRWVNFRTRGVGI